MPNDDVLRLAVIGQILRRRWRLLCVLAVLGAVVGAAASLLWPPAYQSSSRVLLLGELDKAQVLSQAQVAMSLVVLDRAATGLNWGVGGSDLRDSVTASVVADGNVIEIVATAKSPERARGLAEAVTQQYIAFSTELLTRSVSAADDVLTSRKDALQHQIADMSRRMGELQGTAAGPKGAAGRAELQQLTDDRTQAVNELNDADAKIAQAQAQAAASRDNFSVIEPPVAPRAAVASSRIVKIASGAALAPVLGALALVAIRQADRRLRNGSDIAAALGAPLLGTVGIPPDSEPDSEVSTLSASLNGSLNGHGGIGSRGQPLEYLCCRRVLARLGAAPGESVTLLVVIADGDVLARRAVDCLRVAAISMSADKAADRALDKAQPGPAAVFSVVSVSAARPTIPDTADVSAVLVVVTSGTRTAWELLAVTEACQDAGHPIAGVLTVLPGAGVGPSENTGPEQVLQSTAVGGPNGRTDEEPT